MIKNLKHFKIKTERELTKILHDHIKYSPKIKWHKSKFYEAPLKTKIQTKGNVFNKYAITLLLKVSNKIILKFVALSLL